MKKQQGFTLIELMIVVAIIGILAAIAIPAYQDYIARSQISEAVTLLGGAKTAVEEVVSQTAVFPATTDAAGLASSLGVTTTGKYVTTVAITAGGTNGAGTLTATMKGAGKVSKGIIGDTVTLSRTDAGVWSCSGGVESKYRPQSCR